MRTHARRQPVRSYCGHRIVDGEVIGSRCVKPTEGLALCRCKRWVEVSLALAMCVVSRRLSVVS